MELPIERLDQIVCRQCGRAVDVSAVDPFSVIKCPGCSSWLAVPARLGRYTLLKLIGKGAMGDVYKAWDPTLERSVAIKILRVDAADDQGAVKNTVREARALAALNHVNIVHVFAIEYAQDQPYIVMELVTGGRLDTRLARKEPVQEAEALRIAIDVAEGLKAALEARLMHSDVKPANVLMDEQGTAKLVDFGIARAAVTGQASDGQGTPYYIAPEVAKRQPFDHRADIYSLGVTLYHVLAARRPFEGTSAKQVIMARFKQRPADLCQLCPALHRRTADIVDRMMALAPSDRYADYDHLLADLRTALAECTDAAAVAGAAAAVAGAVGNEAPTLPRRKAKRRDATVALVGLGAAFVLIVGVVIFAIVQVNSKSNDATGGAGDGGLAASNDATGAGANGSAYGPSGLNTGVNSGVNSGGLVPGVRYGEKLQWNAPGQVKSEPKVEPPKPAPAPPRPAPAANVPLPKPEPAQSRPEPAPPKPEPAPSEPEPAPTAPVAAPVVPAAPAGDGKPGFIVRRVSMAKGEVKNLATAQKLLTGELQGASARTVVAPVINFIDRGGAIADGHFPDNSPFPGGSGKDDDQFTVEAVAKVYLPVAGAWTFGINCDDGGKLSIAGKDVIVSDVLQSPHDALGVFEAPQPGLYDLRLVYFEATGGATIELFATRGRRSEFNGDFHLVGDTAAGGLQALTSGAGAALAGATGSGAAPYIDPAPPGGAVEFPRNVGRRIGDDAVALIAPNATWHYQFTAPPGKDWTGREAALVGWKAGEAGFGFGEDDMKTTLAEMAAKHTDLYIRRPFLVDNPDAVAELGLVIRYHDAFVAYLNGQEVFRSPNVQGSGPDAAVSPKSYNRLYAYIPLRSPRAKLVKGVNIIAIEGHTRGTDSPIFTLDPFLVARPRPGAALVHAAAGDGHGDDQRPFKPAGEAHGWTPGRNTALMIDQNMLRVRAKGAEPALICKKVDVKEYTGAVVVGFKLRTTWNGTGQVVLKAGNDREEKQPFAIPANGRWQVFQTRFFIKGPVKELRIHLASGQGEVQIEQIGIVTANGVPLGDWSFQKK